MLKTPSQNTRNIVKHGRVSSGHVYLLAIAIIIRAGFELHWFDAPSSTRAELSLAMAGTGEPPDGVGANITAAAITVLTFVSISTRLLVNVEDVATFATTLYSSSCVGRA